MGQNVKKKIFWGYFGGPEGVFNDQTRPILLSSYPLTHIICKYEIGKQSDKKFVSLTPKYENKVQMLRTT